MPVLIEAGAGCMAPDEHAHQDGRAPMGLIARERTGSGERNACGSIARNVPLFIDGMPAEDAAARNPKQVC